MIKHLILILEEAGKRGDWSNWPFGPGYEAGWLLSVTKFLFIGLVLAFIIWILRRVFGPGGPLRDKDLDEDAEQRGKKEALAILRKRLAKGEISSEEYENTKRRLEQ